MSKEILTASHPGIAAVPLRVAPSVGSEFNLVRAFLIPKGCFKLEDAHFAFDSSFVTPDGFDIGPLKALLDKHPGTKLSIFGHADPTGDDSYNKRLSGRRASAIFGLLTRDVALWGKLHDQPAGGDNWKPEAEKTMQATTGLPPGTDRETLFKAYMDHLCTLRDGSGQPAADAAGNAAKVELTTDDFLARGSGKDGKGDRQGCSEFNPLMVFSKEEKAFLDRPENHIRRNQDNQVNRRVMVLLFRPGSQVDPAKWPCPSVEEGVGKCLARFHSDGEKRRSNQALRREFKTTEDTFACRFYERVSNNSPCDVPIPPEDRFTVAALEATLESTQNAVTKVRPAARTFKTSNRALDFAAPANDLMVVVQDAGDIVVKALTIQPPEAKDLVHWQIERNPADTVAAGLPGLSATTGEQVTITPSTPGSFRLVCFRDANGNNSFEAGEEQRVLRLVIVRITPQDGGTLTATTVFAGGVNRVDTDPGPLNPMQLQADFLLEGGGADQRFGLDQVVLGNVGNLLADDFVVNYPGRPAPRDTRDGTEEEDPDFRTSRAPGFPSPMVDTSRVNQGREPTGGATPFRSRSREPIQGNGPGGNGQIRRVTGEDAPAFVWGGTHPRTGNPWATTQGTNAFREFIVAFTTKFNRNYVALGQGDWTVDVIGTRGAGGRWVDNGASVTSPAAWTSAGFPKTGDASGVQVLGRSFVSEFGMIVRP